MAHHVRRFNAVSMQSEATMRVSTPPGADPGFLLGGGAPLRNGVTDW